MEDDEAKTFNTLVLISLLPQISKAGNLAEKVDMH